MGSQTSSISTRPSRQSTVRTSRCSPSSSAGGRVWGVTVSSPIRGPIVSASRTSAQPVGVFHVVISVFVPGSYARADGTLMPNGPSLNDPASRSSSDPNTLGESKLGTQSQSTEPSGATSAPVWQFDRKAYSAMGVNGDGDAALCATAAAGAFSAGLPLPVAGLGLTVLMTPAAFRSNLDPERRVSAGCPLSASPDASEMGQPGF